MDYVKDKIKMAKLERNIARAKEQVNKRRKALRAEALENRKREFNKLSPRERRIHEALGWSPYQADQIVRRESGSFSTK